MAEKVTGGVVDFDLEAYAWEAVREVREIPC
jgi:hypothetical protein